MKGGEGLEEKPTIAMLLDIEHLHGGHEGRLGPLLAVLISATLPTLIYVYLGATAFMPLWLFIPIALILPIGILLVGPGRQKYRVAVYKKQLDDNYDAASEMMNIKAVHPDGCIEYNNNKICYLVSCFNGTSVNDLQRSAQVRKLLESMFGDYEFDIHIHNIDSSPELYDYYNRVQQFSKNTAARNFISMIDHTIDLTEDTSVVQCTIYAIKARRSDWQMVRKQIDSALESSAAKCYKTIYRVDDEQVINSIVNRDIDGVIKFSEMIRHKYANQHYGTSKVLAYDLPEDKEIIQGPSVDVEVVHDTAPIRRKHIMYKEK